ncbi:hypothetical protein NM688_g3481 [Phlebia brevispora]|uniref:Uncharacterized protein n=1 Tax=Phlebia brevispora TaxID=194682 RepID=A0ACC1T5G3_9APHY|nr:hypothetical protein NM688_g3481 [Phlebia brevispora]
MQPPATPRPSQDHPTNSRFRENLSIYVPPSDLPIQASRFSPESPPAESSRTHSMWTTTATVRSATPIRKETVNFRSMETQPTPSYKSRFTKFWFDVRTLVSPREPQLVPIQEPELAPWPPLHIEKRACCHNCPCHSLQKKDSKKRKRQKIFVGILVVVILYLLGNSIALNTRVFGASSPPRNSADPQNATVASANTLSADAQQCLSQYEVNAPSNPTQYPCSTCLPVLQAVPPNFSDGNVQDPQQITNAIQFCALRAVFETTDSDGQSSLKDQDWVQDVRFCAWTGVQCDGSGRVSSLTLTFPGVPSLLPNELTALEDLQSLTVIGNSASPAGSLPSNFSSWTTLSTLHLESTSITSLPDNLFAALSKMTTLTLVKNGQMGNNLPSSVTGSSLQNLIVNSQPLSNPLSALSSSQSLQSSMKLIDLSETTISGIIPSTIANFTSLTELHLDGNSLATPLPSTFPASLQTLSLANNTGLTGPVQGSFCSLGNLQTCNMIGTGLSAPNGCGVLMPPRDENAFHESENLYAKATKAELERDYDRAFQLYVKAAEGFLHLSRTTTDPAFTTTCKANAARALERAEKIKTAKRDITPVATDRLSQREQLLVLQKSSTINGTFYPLWSEATSTASAHSAKQPALSPEQVGKSAVWRRCSHRPIADPEHPLAPQDVVQHVISDCSVCASVALCIEHSNRFNSRLGLSVLYPQDGDGVPIASADGRYYLRLFFNGANRRIDIDDQLPTYPDGTLMCMSTGVNQALWPSLIEKAYMKLMGGYDFPGSLSSTDLHTLIGWIPEYVDLTSPDFEMEKTWRKISAGFTEGLCVLTVGTGRRLSVDTINSMPLLPVHCYAVINIGDNADARTMTILDTWTGASSEDELGIDLTKLDLKDTRHARSCSLSWDTICSTFEGIYLNWDPKLFPHKLDLHSTWKKDVNDHTSYPRRFQVQLKIDHNSDGHQQRDVWLLLTRHVVDSHRMEEYVSLTVHNDDMRSGVVSVKGEYTNGTHVLVKTEYSSTDPVLSIVASYDAPYDDAGFTITAYACSPMRWEDTAAKLLYREKVSGTFTAKNAGGNPTLSTFMINPQYHLRLYPPKAEGSGRGSKGKLNVTLQGDRHIPLGATLVWSHGQRITEISNNETVASSGAYSYGFTSFSQEVSVGDYSLIVSAFEPHFLGSFSLEIDSSLRFEMTPIDQEGAGMFTKIIQDSWSQSTAAGGPNFKKYTANPVYKLHVPRQTQLIVRLQLNKPTPAVSINVTIFNATEKLGLGPHITTSGPYTDAVSGVVTPQIAVQPGTYYIIPSTFNPGVHTRFKMIVYSSASGVTASRSHLPVK